MSPVAVILLFLSCFTTKRYYFVFSLHLCCSLSLTYVVKTRVCFAGRIHILSRQTPFENMMILQVSFFDRESGNVR